MRKTCADCRRGNTPSGVSAHDARPRSLNDESAAMNVGFIGLGTMGAPMARNVLKGGHSLTVFDLNRAACDALAAAGASIAPSPKALAAASEIVITMVPDAPDVEKIAFGADGILGGMRA